MSNRQGIKQGIYRNISQGSSQSLRKDIEL